MSRVAIYGVPGIDQGAPPVARQLLAAAEAWYASHPDITRDPRRYGFHATLKAPFELATDTSIADLERAVAEFALARPPLVLRKIGPAILGSFRALVPRGEHHEIDRLAADVVRTFDRFRAPLTAQDVARRHPESLTARQREILDDWGYPYSLDEFRFHLTLTDSLSDDAEKVDAAIAEHFADLDGVDIPLTSLALAIEPIGGRPFAVHSIHPFREAL